MSKLRHATKFCFREYGAVVADQVGSDYASRADSYATLEHSFQAYLDVAASFQCEVVDLLHHWLGTASVDGIKFPGPENGFGDFGDLVLLSVCSVVGGENEFELMFFAVGRQPVLEEKLAGCSRSCDEGDVSAAKVNQERQQRDETCPAPDHQEFVMVPNAVRMSVGSTDPEKVAGLLLPESCTDWATFLDDNPRFVLAMDCEHAHRHLVNAWDPDHGELSRVSFVQAYVTKPE
jgi:hypothetical protein